MPDINKSRENQQRLLHIEKSLEKNTSARDRILNLIIKDKITESQAENQLDELNCNEKRLQAELIRLRDSLENIPSPEAIKALSQKIGDSIQKRRIDGKKVRLIADIKHANHAFDTMSWEDKKSLIEMVFSGKTAEGKRMGIYLEWVDGQKKIRYKHKKYKYTIAGHLIDIEGHTPINEARRERFFFGAPHLQKELVTKSGPYMPLR